VILNWLICLGLAALSSTQQSRRQGTVLLSFVITPEGTTRGIHVLRPLGLGLDEKAVETALHWRFQPCKKDGKAGRLHGQR
jgi:TonB family protein